MLMAGFVHVMRSHLQFKAVLDNAVIRFEMQKSSLKLNNIFVTVLRGTDCLEPRWSLDLEYFGGALAANNWKITSAVLQRVLKTCSSSVQFELKKNVIGIQGKSQVCTQCDLGEKGNQSPLRTGSSSNTKGG